MNDDELPLPRESFAERVQRKILGERHDVNDPHALHKISLIAFLAWVGLGADAGILSITVFGKFGHGGWVTVLLTTIFVLLCLAVPAIMTRSNPGFVRSTTFFERFRRPVQSIPRHWTATRQRRSFSSAVSMVWACTRFSPRFASSQACTGNSSSSPLRLSTPATSRAAKRSKRAAPDGRRRAGSTSRH